MAAGKACFAVNVEVIMTGDSYGKAVGGLGDILEAVLKSTCGAAIHAARIPKVNFSEPGVVLLRDGEAVTRIDVH